MKVKSSFFTKLRAQALSSLALAGLLLAGAAGARAQERPMGQGVIVRVGAGYTIDQVNSLLGTTGYSLQPGANLYLLQSPASSTSGSTSSSKSGGLLGGLLGGVLNLVGDLPQQTQQLVTLHVLDSTEPNFAVQFSDANLNQSSMSVLNQSSMSVLNQSSMSVLNGEGANYYGSPVNSAYLSQPAVAQIQSSTAAGRHATGAGVLVADIDNGADPTNLVLLGSYAMGWNFYDGTPDWSCWADQSVLGLVQANGLSVVSANNAPTSSNINQSSMSVLNQSSMSVLNQSTISVLNQGDISTSGGNIVAAPGYTLFLEMYSQHPEFGHGTAVLGMLHLIAPQARLMPVKSFSPDGEGDLASILSGIYFATNAGAGVINMSFSSATNSSEMATAVAYAYGQGVVLVASAGNNASNETVYPGAYPHVLNTAAVDGQNNLASFSDYGASINVAAPGVALITSYPDNLWAVASGTSFSAPLVAGEAALLLSRQHPNGAVDTDVDHTAESAIAANAGGAVGNGLIQVGMALAAFGIQP